MSVTSPVLEIPPRKRWLALIVGVQFSVPAVALAMEPPTRLGFQMYSGLGEVPEITITANDGSTDEVAIGDVVAVPRPELDWSIKLPEHLCGTKRDAHTVRLSWVAAGKTLEHSCVRTGNT